MYQVHVHIYNSLYNTCFLPNIVLRTCHVLSFDPSDNSMGKIHLSLVSQERVMERLSLLPKVTEETVEPGLKPRSSKAQPALYPLCRLPNTAGIGRSLIW